MSLNVNKYFDGDFFIEVLSEGSIYRAYLHNRDAIGNSPEHAKERVQARLAHEARNGTSIFELQDPIIIGQNIGRKK